LSSTGASASQLSLNLMHTGVGRVADVGSSRIDLSRFVPSEPYPQIVGAPETVADE
jgi:hypothetical protein